MTRKYFEDSEQLAKNISPNYRFAKEEMVGSQNE